ncbi:WD40 repeat-like protein [Dendrothele bispora CBS 962.96]|uniref:WD40 repeat-like protein n=1 Tax=Dendrothele bispora (strain CBS 962.96) TaxID=1314807 RepID=A0A4S8M0G4_DENBC|nr:WD40 repeat-like protein [Dendrothele bispora CBS 962.96]
MGAIISYLRQKHFSRAKSYAHLVNLSGPRDAILSVSFSVNAKFVAAAGCGGITIWDLSTFAPVATPYVDANVVTPENMFSVSSWVFFENGKREVVVLGTVQGGLLFWEWRKDHRSFEPFCKLQPSNDSGPVTSIDFYERRVPSKNHARVVMSTAVDRSVGVWSLSVSHRELKKIFKINLEETFLPRTVHFIQETREVIVFSRNGGRIRILHYKTGNTQKDRRCGADPIGPVAFNECSEHFVTWTGRNFDLYTLENLDHVRTFNGGTPVVPLPKEVVFVDQGRYILAGTDHGCAVLYDTSTGSIARTLKYSGVGLVQQVSPEFEILAIAGSTFQQEASVDIFKSPRRNTQGLDKFPTRQPALKQDDDDMVFIGFSMRRAPVLRATSSFHQAYAPKILENFWAKPVDNQPEALSSDYSQASGLAFQGSDSTFTREQLGAVGSSEFTTQPHKPDSSFVHPTDSVKIPEYYHDHNPSFTRTDPPCQVHDQRAENSLTASVPGYHAFTLLAKFGIHHRFPVSKSLT